MASLPEELTASGPRSDGRGFSDDETLRAGQELASAVGRLLVWNFQQ
jgi:hypothetical protein